MTARSAAHTHTVQRPTEVIHGVLSGLARRHADENSFTHVVDGAEEGLVFNVEPRQDACPTRVGEENGSISVVCARDGQGAFFW